MKFFALLLLLSVQCIVSWEIPNPKNTAVWNYVSNRTSKVIQYFKEKVSYVKTVFISGKNVIVTFAEDKISKLRDKFRGQINVAKSKASTIYESIFPEHEEYNCSDNDIGNHMPTPQLIALHGYDSESHTVTTEDGYILTIHRIPYPKINNNKTASRRTVLLHHGLLASSADWVLPGPDKGLAYMLSDAGYDVWMANARGNTYSRAHVSKHDNSFEFWNFTFHEIGYYDLPAVIDYIIDKKGKDVEINYIGFSMGTTVLFVLLSKKPEYNHKIKTGYALAPIAYMSKIKGPLDVIADYGNNIEGFMKIFGANEFLPRNIVIRFLAKHSCTISSFEEALCEMSMYVLCGYNREFDRSLQPMIFGHVPAGASTKTLAHYAQEIKNHGRFQQFDYGGEQNMKIYGSLIPPAYPVEKIALPMVLFSGDDDWLSSMEDSNNLYRKLPNTIDHIVIKGFNHLDFIFAREVSSLVYSKILKSLSEEQTSAENNID